ncbi:Piso0_000068 [Millerozyma farinosa CBS 7064]|uniref:Ubiquitin-like 1-activating enzyme E1A n=1 Tax=Pichia sorbitophila (strain ATCC MYA-4447 / BCRC 22081 / CBS 7064 / NBRC 10061 / NRRL Y-12695) TaxID=559304 RepID=G8YUF7_PICSO|nr:Piso0_000068 [Millerozyma farinosa CBS 7064]
MGTQLRLRSTKILLINLGAIGSEVVKNLVLGGINSLEILDSSKLKEEDFSSQFFLPDKIENIGKLKLPLVIDQIKDLNNRVNLTINTATFESIFDNEDKANDYLSNFDLIIATEMPKASMIQLNSYTRKLNIPLYVAGMHGMFGYVLVDLIKHTSVVTKDMGNQPRRPNTKINSNKLISSVSYDEKEKKENITIIDTYKPISDMFSSKELPNQLNRRQLKRLSAAFPLIFTLFDVEKPTDIEDSLDVDMLREKACLVCEKHDIPTAVITDEYLDFFSRQAFTEFAPVAAIIGGCLAQDVIQYLSKKESPINNCLIVDTIRPEMPIYVL